MQSDGKVPVMLLRPGEVVPDRILHKGQIELNWVLVLN